MNHELMLNTLNFLEEPLVPEEGTWHAEHLCDSRPEISVGLGAYPIERVITLTEWAVDILLIGHFAPGAFLHNVPRLPWALDLLGHRPHRSTLSCG